MLQRTVLGMKTRCCNHIILRNRATEVVNIMSEIQVCKRNVLMLQHMGHAEYEPIIHPERSSCVDRGHINVDIKLF